MLQRKWGKHHPQRGDGMPRGGRKERQKIEICRCAREDQYSLGSSKVVTLRSHSVMIQSCWLGVIW